MHIKGFPCGSAGKETACHVGDPSSIPELGRSTGEGKGYPLRYSGLENSMDCIVHGVSKSWTQLSDFHFLSIPFLIKIIKINHLKIIDYLSLASEEAEMLSCF